MSKLLQVSELRVSLKSKRLATDIIDNVSLEVPSDCYTLGMVGESGSGKTTLAMSILNALEPPLEICHGSVEFCGKNVLSMPARELRRYRWEQVSLIPQAAMNSLNPVKRVTDPIVEVILEHTNTSKKDALDTASRLLSDVGISAERFDSYPYQLSGGMRQRVTIALALALSPKLLIADEPTSAVDVVVQKQLISLLRAEIKRRNLSLLYVTHELSILSGLVEHLMVMYGGGVVERGPAEKVLLEPLHPYSKMLVGSLLTFSSTLHGNRDTSVRLAGDLEGSPPTRGCRYSTRCEYAVERCRTERPELAQVGNERWVACHLVK